MLRLDAFDRDVGRKREHHHLHHREQRNGRSQQQGARLASHQRFAACRIVGPGAVADGGNRAQHVGQSHYRRIENHAPAPRCKVHVGDRNPGTPPEPLLDKPSAGAAMNALEQQRYVALAVGRGAYESRLERRIVITQPSIGSARFVDVGTGDIGTPFVECVEPRDMDCLRDAKTSRTAEFTGLPAAHRTPSSGLGVRLSTMEAHGALVRGRLLAGAGPRAAGRDGLGGFVHRTESTERLRGGQSNLGPSLIADKVSIDFGQRCGDHGRR